MSDSNLMTDGAPDTESAASTTTGEPATTADGTQSAPEATEQKQGTFQASTGAGTQSAPDKAAPKAPEKYEPFKFADGKSLSDEQLADVTAQAAALGLTQEQAQKLADSELKRAEGVQAQQEAVIADLREQWAQAARDDKEFGGEKFEENLATARTALDAFGSDTLKNLLAVSGMGNHPEFIRFCHNVGKSIQADGVVTGGPARAQHDPKRLYPKSDMND